MIKIDIDKQIVDKLLLTIESSKKKLGNIFDKESKAFQVYDDAEKLLKSQIEDLEQNDRKLRIAIAGPIKAGKSTFLNSYLFNGKNILPTAATPKTAVLTKIIYSENPFLEVEYYSKDDWRAIEDQAIKDEANDNYNTPSIEIVDMVEDRDLNVQPLLGRKEHMNASNQEELENLLNKYVGDDGSHTPVVKMVTMGIASEEMKHIEVYDTPGLNDPVASREYTTRSFMSSTDVIFFLSQSSKFLSESDMDLLSRQFPQEGVRNIHLLGSQFDSALYQAAGDSDSKNYISLEELADAKERDLKAGAERICSARSELLGEERGSILMKSLPPLFFSSRALMWQMKERLLFSVDEEFDYLQLEKEGHKRYGDSGTINDALINRIACRERIQTLFDESVNNKEGIINDKIAHIVPNIKRSINEKLHEFEKNQEAQLELLEKGDLQDIINTQKDLEIQMGTMGEAIEEELGVLAQNVKSELNSLLSDLQSRITTIAEVRTHQGSETKYRTEYYTVTRGILFWKREEERSREVAYTSNYTYTTTADALESLVNLAGHLTMGITEGFQRSVDPKKAKLNLKKKIMGTLDTGSSSYNPTFYRLTVEEAVNDINIPHFELSPEPFMEKVKGLFTGEVRGEDLSSLRMAVLSTAQTLFKEASGKATEKATYFQKEIKEMKASLQEKILESSKSKLSTLKEDLSRKEESLSFYKNGISLIKEIRKEL